MRAYGEDDVEGVGLFPAQLVCPEFELGFAYFAGAEQGLCVESSVVFEGVFYVSAFYVSR